MGIVLEFKRRSQSSTGQSKRTKIKKPMDVATAKMKMDAIQRSHARALTRYCALVAHAQLRTYGTEGEIFRQTVEELAKKELIIFSTYFNVSLYDNLSVTAKDLL